MKKPVFKTGNVGVEFVDKSQVANEDSEVLPRMVNSEIAADRRGDIYGKGDRREKPAQKG